jgi:hypothetical protein
MYKGIIRAGSSISITYASNASTRGTTILMAGTGQNGTSDSQVKTIVPAASDKIALHADDGVKIIRIIVDVPDNGGSGTLTVTADDGTNDNGSISGDTTWVYTVE